MSAMRGLTMFIADVRSCTTKEAEEKRVVKELAHIRTKFTQKNLDGYGKKKYTWKLLYMYMLGYEIEIGHMVAVKLLTSNKYSEKNCGYMACQILLHENHELLRLIIQSVKKDLVPPKGKQPNEVFQCLALSCVANVGGQEVAEALTKDVERILVSGQSRSFVRKKAALCLLRLYRKYPDLIPGDTWPSKVITLLEDGNYGVVTSVMSLVLGLVSHSPVGYEEAPAKCTNLLSSISFKTDIKSSYKYYSTISPWLQVKLLKLLQYFPPPEDAQMAQKLSSVLNGILTKTKLTNIVNKNNADHAILFEAINVIIHMCLHGQAELQTQAIGLLGRFIQIKEPNFRYLGLNTMAKLAIVPGSLPHVKRHQNTIKFSLDDQDVSIRKRALDLLYVMTDHSNSEEIVNVMLTHLDKEEVDAREELVLKIAILAEKFAPNLKWYVDVVLQLISEAGDFVTDDIWHRVVQIVTNEPDLQQYAAETCWTFLNKTGVHENGVKVGAYVLGEFGHKIADIKMAGAHGEPIMAILKAHFRTCSDPTRALILSSFVKLASSYPELKPQVDKIFKEHMTYADAEIQQRATEFNALDTMAKQGPEQKKLADMALGPMPPFPVRKSVLLRRLNRKKKTGTTDRDVWNGEEEEPEEDEEDDEEEDDESEFEDDEGQVAEEEEDEKGAAPSGGGGLDLLGVFEDTSAPAPAAVPAQIGTQGLDPFADDFGMSATPAVASAAANAELDFPAQNVANLKNCLNAPVGLSLPLYESTPLTVTFKAPPTEMASETRMALYLKNNTSTPLANCSWELPSEAEFRVQSRLTIGDQLIRDPSTPFTLSPGVQVINLFLWNCKRPVFSACPSLTLKVNGGQHKVSFQVPVVISSFMKSPEAALDKAKFIGFWEKFGNEVGPSIYTTPGVMTYEEIQKVVTETMKMKQVDGVDGKATNLYAAAVFHSVVMNAQGKPVTMPCFLRVETMPGKNFFRLTARGGHQQVSTALITAFSLITGASPK
eukprot:gb/GEZN01000944.1/.p1 GENE.gb/GEZN01000944.1/~~gb/GEZN01000944.1/.p1  ORF type:complete len:996 (-),score=239.00 gb/GEZN01000944.1/:356-3343(-)